jgi:predicted transcriptional regulator
VGGLHATLGTTPYLSLLARLPGFKKEDLDRELYDEHTLGKMRCVRKTIYVHSKDMLPVVFGATTGMVARASKKYVQRRVSSEDYERISQAILDLLKGAELTATEIKTALGTKADVSAILYFLCDQGLLVRGRPQGGWKDKRQRYARFDDYFPGLDLQSVSEAEATSLLARQYLAAFGPATENDLAWWLGLGKTRARKALKDLQGQLSRVAINGVEGEFILLRSDEALLESSEPPARPIVNLLPALDSYLMGYKERARYLDEGHYDKVFDRSGNATSTILAHGQVAGVWDFEDGEHAVVKLFLLKKIAQDALEGLYAQAQNVGNFMAGREVQVRECDAMVPLTEQSAGSFMSPLK